MTKALTNVFILLIQRSKVDTLDEYLMLANKKKKKKIPANKFVLENIII